MRRLGTSSIPFLHRSAPVLFNSHWGKRLFYSTLHYIEAYIVSDAGLLSGICRNNYVFFFSDKAYSCGVSVVNSMAWQSRSRSLPTKWLKRVWLWWVSHFWTKIKKNWSNTIIFNSSKNSCVFKEMTPLPPRSRTSLKSGERRRKRRATPTWSVKFRRLAPPRLRRAMTEATRAIWTWWQSQTTTNQVWLNEVLLVFFVACWQF